MKLGDIVIVKLTDKLDAPAIVTRVLSTSVVNLTVLPEFSPAFHKQGVTVYPTEAEARATPRRFAAWPKDPQ